MANGPGSVPRLRARVPAGRAARVRDPVAAHARDERRPTATATCFEAEMLLCGALALALMLSILLRLEAGPARTVGALAFAALAPLAARLGRALAVRPLAGGARASARSPRSSSGRDRLGAGALGAGRSRRSSTRRCSCRSRRSGSGGGRGRREARVCLGVSRVACSPSVFLPFVVLSPHGVWHSLTTQTSRPLQIETLGVGRPARRCTRSAGSGSRCSRATARRTSPGGGPDALAVLQTVAAGGGADRGLGLVRARAGRPRPARPRVRGRRSARSSPSARCSRRSS